MAKINEIDFKDFLRVFNNETMPKNKDELMITLYTFYCSGVKNENERLKNKLFNFIEN